MWFIEIKPCVTQHNVKHVLNSIGKFFYLWPQPKVKCFPFIILRFRQVCGPRQINEQSQSATLISYYRQNGNHSHQWVVSYRYFFHTKRALLLKLEEIMSYSFRCVFFPRSPHYRNCKRVDVYAEARAWIRHVGMLGEKFDWQTERAVLIPGRSCR